MQEKALVMSRPDQANGSLDGNSVNKPCYLGGHGSGDHYPELSCFFIRIKGNYHICTQQSFGCVLTNVALVLF